MGATTIEWTGTQLKDGSWVPGFTFNPWWGCEKISEGCKWCYAEALDNRYHNSDPHWGPGSTRKMQSEKYWKEPEKWNRLAEQEGVRRKVFCASMADVFEERPELFEIRTRLFNLIEDTPWLDWLLLTKRPENIMIMLPTAWRPIRHDNPLLNGKAKFTPPDNLWLGCTAENQERFEQRMPWMHMIRKVHPEVILFLSCEPLLSDINLLPELQNWNTISWVIVGGESGSAARAMNPKHAWHIISDCIQARVPVFFKQWGEYRPVEEPGFYNPSKSRWGHVDFKRLGKHQAGNDFYGQFYKQFPKTKYEL
jgi:protein gp37